MLNAFKFFLIIISLVTIWVDFAQAEIRSEVINYEVAGQPFQGYLSYNDAISVKRPGVLVVHEWWGKNGYARKRAEMLAKLGYTAFALDMYGTGKLAKHPEDAKKFMQEVTTNMALAEQRFNAAKQFLQNQATVDAENIAAIGYCFGGGIVLHMARQGSDLAGVVSFHGSLTTQNPAQTNQVKAKILVLNGADDPFVTQGQISAFKREMQNANVNLEFINYPGVKHSFTNPDADDYGRRFNLPLVYNEEADKDSWQKMQLFLHKVFN